VPERCYNCEGVAHWLRITRVEGVEYWSSSHLIYLVSAVLCQKNQGCKLKTEFLATV